MAAYVEYQDDAGWHQVPVPGDALPRGMLAPTDSRSVRFTTTDNRVVSIPVNPQGTIRATRVPPNILRDFGGGGTSTPPSPRPSTPTSSTPPSLATLAPFLAPLTNPIVRDYVLNEDNPLRSPSTPRPSTPTVPRDAQGRPLVGSLPGGMDVPINYPASPPTPSTPPPITLPSSRSIGSEQPTPGVTRPPERASWLQNLLSAAGAPPPTPAMQQPTFSSPIGEITRSGSAVPTTGTLASGFGSPYRPTINIPPINFTPPTPPSININPPSVPPPATTIPSIDVSGAINAANSYAPAIGGLINQGGGLLQGLANSISSGVNNLLSTFSGLAGGGGIPPIAPTAVNIPQVPATNLTGVSSLSSSLGQVWSTITQGLNSLVGAFTSIPAQMSSSLSGLGSAVGSISQPGPQQNAAGLSPYGGGAWDIPPTTRDSFSGYTATWNYPYLIRRYAGHGYKYLNDTILSRTAEWTPSQWVIQAPNA